MKAAVTLQCAAGVVWQEVQRPGRHVGAEGGLPCPFSYLLQ